MSQTPGVFLLSSLARPLHSPASSLGGLTYQWHLSPPSSLRLHPRCQPKPPPTLDWTTDGKLPSCGSPCSPSHTPGILSSLEARVVLSTGKWEHIITIFKTSVKTSLLTIILGRKPQPRWTLAASHPASPSCTGPQPHWPSSLPRSRSAPPTTGPLPVLVPLPGMLSDSSEPS